MKPRSLLPFETFTLKTPLSETDVQEKIASILEPEIIFTRFQKRNKPYEGWIDGNTFELHRILNYRNSFNPRIIGEVSSDNGYTVISVKSRPMILVLIFISIWLGIVGLACVGIVVAAIFNLGRFWESGAFMGAWVPFVMFAGGYAMLTIGHKSESKNSKNFLIKLLAAEEI